MPVKALKEYIGVPLDAVENYHGNQLIYIEWQHHQMFCAPIAMALPPATRFGDIVTTLLPQNFGYHPDWQRVDLAALEWSKSGQPWSPDPNLTLAELGIAHKQVLRFVTPGLNGINGSAH